MEARDGRKRNRFQKRGDTKHSSSGRSTLPPSIPEHLLASLPAPILHQTKAATDADTNNVPEPSISSTQEKKSHLDDLRAKMAELRAKKTARLAAAAATNSKSDSASSMTEHVEHDNHSSVGMIHLNPPPPPISFAKSARRKTAPIRTKEKKNMQAKPPSWSKL
jgi:hypothetical protein